MDSVLAYSPKLPRKDGTAGYESLNIGKWLGSPFRTCDLHSVVQSNRKAGAGARYMLARDPECLVGWLAFVKL
jgi:hypothetical protein